MSLIITMEDPDDPYRFSARAVQREEHLWDVEYFREGVLVADGTISTPPPHQPPTATLLFSLADYRRVADKWAERGGEPPELLPAGWEERRSRDTAETWEHSCRQGTMTAVLPVGVGCRVCGHGIEDTP